MNCRSKLLGALGIIALAMAQAGCASFIPREVVPPGWTLDVHQPGSWWTQPLIPRSVVVQRCSPPPGWSSDPNLAILTGLPPGTTVEYSLFADDFHCQIGWSEPSSEITFTAGEMATEQGLRRICSSSGLPMDASWRYLGSNAVQRLGEPGIEEAATTAAFIDDEQTVVSCLVEHMGEAGGGATVELSGGAGTVAAAAAACPVVARELARDDDGTAAEYRLRGAGAVRDDAGRVLVGAKTLELGLVGDSVTTSHPVVEGIAIVDARVTPKADIHFDWDRLPPVEGRVLGQDGEVLATCHG